MKKSVRMIAKPGTFIGQLQWSRNHWGILFAFLTLAGLETMVGSHQAQYGWFASRLQSQFGMGQDMALFLLMGAKMALMAGAAFLLATAIWFVGNALGKRTSKRVLFRRLAVVFTVLLAGSLLGNLDLGAWAEPAKWVLWGWGILLAYHAVKEQFALGFLEAGLVGALALFLAVGAWHYSDQAIAWGVKNQTQKHSIARPGNRGRAARPVW